MSCLVDELSRFLLWYVFFLFLSEAPLVALINSSHTVCTIIFITFKSSTHTDVKVTLYNTGSLHYWESVCGHYSSCLSIWSLLTCMLKKKVLEISSTVALISSRSSGTSTTTHVGSIIILRKQSQLSTCIMSLCSLITSLSLITGRCPDNTKCRTPCHHMTNVFHV